jgi:sialidase-1
MKTTILFATALALCLGGFAPAQTKPLEPSTIWRSGADGYAAYRIPAVILSPAGSLLAFCEGRESFGDSGEIKLLMKRSTDGGRTFSPQQIIGSDDKNTCGNPCPVVDQSTGTIWLLMTHNLGSDREPQIMRGTARGKRTVWITSSKDDGRTWAAPREISSSVSKPQWTWYATGPGIGIQLTRGKHKGRLIIPCDHMSRQNIGNAHIIYSDNHGQTWHIGGEAPKAEFNESQVVELSDGRVMLNMRNHAAAIKKGAPRERGVCISDDGGMTFKDLRRDPALIEPVCQASIIRIGNKLLFSNPASTTRREKMTVRQSSDDGATWPVSRLIYKGPSAYSCLVSLPDGSAGLLYECGEKSPYERIDFARFSMP